MDVKRLRIGSIEAFGDVEGDEFFGGRSRSLRVNVVVAEALILLKGANNLELSRKYHLSTSILYIANINDINVSAFKQ